MHNTDPGMCYIDAYVGVEKKQKMAYLIGPHPNWGSVLDAGNLDNVPMRAVKNRDGTWHVFKAYGTGVSPWKLPLPRDAIVGGPRTTTQKLGFVGLVLTLLFGVRKIPWILAFLMFDQMTEHAFVTNNGVVGIYGTQLLAFSSLGLLMLPTAYGEELDVMEDVNSEESEFTTIEVDADVAKVINDIAMKFNLDPLDIVRTLKQLNFDLTKPVDLSTIVGKVQNLLMTDTQDTTVKVDSSSPNNEPIDMTVELAKLELDDDYLPKGFESVHGEYIDSLDFDLKNYEMCSNEPYVRVKLLETNVDDDSLMAYLQFMCPQLPASKTWLTQAKRMKMKWKRTSRTLTSSYGDTKDTVESDVSEVADAIAKTHSMVRTVVREGLNESKALSEEVGKSMQKSVQSIQKFPMKATEEAIDVIENVAIAIRTLVNESKELPVTLTDVAVETVKEIDKLHGPEVMKDKIVKFTKLTRDFVDHIIENGVNGSYLGKAVTTVCTDGVTATKSIYNATNETVKQLWDDTPTKQNISETLQNITKYSWDKVSSLMNWTETNVKDKMKLETVSKVVSATPWLTETFGKTVAGPIKGFVSNLPMASPNTVKEWREAIFGPPKVNTWFPIKRTTVFSIYGDSSKMETFVTVLLAILVAVVLTLVIVQFGTHND